MSARKVIGCNRLDGGADCLITLGCSGCANAIYEQESPPPAFACKTSHYHACACREHKVAVLIKSALDAARELEQLPRTPLNVELRGDASRRPA